MKYIYKILTIICLLAIIMTVVNTKPVQENITTTSSVNQEYNYLIKSFNGKIAVYEKDKDNPIKVYNIYINSLTENDIMLLNKGIKVKSKNELELKIEDYIS